MVGDDEQLESEHTILQRASVVGSRLVCPDAGDDLFRLL